MRALNFSKLSEKSCKWNLSLLRFARNDRGRSVKGGYAKLSEILLGIGDAMVKRYLVYDGLNMEMKEFRLNRNPRFITFLLAGG